MSETTSKQGTAAPLGDDRIATKAAAAGGAARTDRSSADEQRTNKDGTALTLEERRKMLRSEWLQEVLPTPPAVPGWHYCWLSTTNSTDPIYKRIQRGYQPVKALEIPGFLQYKVDGGEFEGCVACNEMLLFKIEEELYQDLMAYFHHELPMEEEQMLRNNAVDNLQRQDSNGRELGEIEGFDSLARRVRTPTFQ